MMNALDLLAEAGHWSIDALWLPMLVWTAVALPVYLTQRWTASAHTRYWTTLGLLAALPAGVLGAALFTPEADLTRQAGVVLTLPSYSTSVHAVADSPLFSWTVWHTAGLLALAAGMLALLRAAGLAAATLGLDRYRRSTVDRPPSFVTDEAALLCERIGLRESVRIAISTARRSPHTFGWRSPVIVLPESLLDSREDLRLALAHELVHVRRLDYVWHWFEQIIGALFLIHPLVLLLRREASVLREITCDADVVAVVGQRSRYARLLYQYSAARDGHQVLAVGILQENHLQKRIMAMKNLLDFTKLNRSKRIGLAVSAVLLAMSVAVVACTDMIVRSTPDDATSADVFSVVEQMPELVGGLASVMDDLKYPELAKNAGVEGRVLVEFVVDERGKVIHATVAEGLGSGLDEAAVAAVEKATFKPGVQNGEPVKVKMVMPITFKLSDEAGPETIGEALRKGQDAATEEVLVDRELVDQMPELIGGLEAIQKDLAYPTLAKRAGIEGRVLIEFVVGKDGAVHDARVAEGLGSGLDEEALRAVRNARFEPAMKDGRPAALTLMLPITFKLPTISTESSGAMSVTYNVADGIIEGRVIDDATGLGIGGVNVSVDGSVEGAATGPDGAFKLRLRKAGLAVDLRVTRSGFAPIVIRDAAQR